MDYRPALGLSNKRKLPVWKIHDWTFALWDILNLQRVRHRFEELRLRKTDDGHYVVTMYGFPMKLQRYYAVAVVNEMAYFEEDYCSVIDLRGKTVLDVGCGNGETALVFLQHGARKVIGIDSDRDSCKFARYNRDNLSLNMEIINEPFALEHLDIPHDLVKMDIEGGEALLMNYRGDLGPIVLEAHGEALRQKLSRRFHLKTVRYPHPDTWILASGLIAANKKPIPQTLRSTAYEIPI